MLTVKPAVCPCDKHVTKGSGLFGVVRDSCHCRASQAVPLTSSSKDILVAESGDECRHPVVDGDLGWPKGEGLSGEMRKKMRQSSYFYVSKRVR